MESKTDLEGQKTRIWHEYVVWWEGGVIRKIWASRKMVTNLYYPDDYLDLE